MRYVGNELITQSLASQLIFEGNLFHLGDFIYVICHSLELAPMSNDDFLIEVTFLNSSQALSYSSVVMVVPRNEYDY